MKNMFTTYIKDNGGYAVINNLFKEKWEWFETENEAKEWINKNGTQYFVMFIPEIKLDKTHIKVADSIGGYLEHAYDEWYDWHDLNLEQLNSVVEHIKTVFKSETIETYKDMIDDNNCLQQVEMK